MLDLSQTSTKSTTTTIPIGPDGFIAVVVKGRVVSLHLGFVHVEQFVIRTSLRQRACQVSIPHQVHTDVNIYLVNNACLGPQQEKC